MFLLAAGLRVVLGGSNILHPERATQYHGELWHELRAVVG